MCKPQMPKAFHRLFLSTIAIMIAISVMLIGCNTEEFPRKNTGRFVQRFGSFHLPIGGEKRLTYYPVSRPEQKDDSLLLAFWRGLITISRDLRSAA
jgi:hypothetical protein